MGSSDKTSPAFPFNKMRIIPYKIFSGIQNMALDLLYVRQVEDSNIPVLRFYGWRPFCLSLGYHQKTDDINIDKIKQSGYDLARRPTGGSAIFHSDELTYSIIIPASFFSHHNLYEMFHTNLARALKKLEYNVSLSLNNNPGSYLNQGKDTFACFNRAAKSEITYNDKKVVGSAQKIFHKSILQHGSILIGKTHQQIIDFLNLDIREKSRQQNYLKEHSIALKEINNKNIPVLKLTETILTGLINSQKISKIYYKYTEDNELRLARSFYDKLDVKIK